MTPLAEGIWTRPTESLDPPYFQNTSSKNFHATSYGTRSAAGKTPPLLYLRVTKAQLAKHKTMNMRKRFISHLMKEFQKGLQLIMAEEEPSSSGTMHEYFFNVGGVRQLSFVTDTPTKKKLKL